MVIVILNPVTTSLGNGVTTTLLGNTNSNLQSVVNSYVPYLSLNNPYYPPTSVGTNSGSSGSGFSLGSFLEGSVIGGIPNYFLILGGVMVLVMVNGKKGR